VLFISKRNNPEVNVRRLRMLLRMIANRRTGQFSVHSLTSKYKDTFDMSNHIVSRLLMHLVQSNYIEIYDKKMYLNGTPRRIIYKRLFDSDLDIDKCVEELIEIDMQIQHRNRMPYLH